MRGVTWGADATSSNQQHLPDGLPVLWWYSTGTPDIRWDTATLLDPRYRYASAYAIDQGFASKGPFDGDEFDVETGAWTVHDMLNIIEARNARRWSTRVYCSHRDRAGIMVAAGGWLDIRSVFFRIADWSVSEAEAAARLGGNIYAWQWASPKSNSGTRLPGTGLTLAEAQCDLNVISLRSTEWQG